MKRSTVLLVSCVALAGSAWLAQFVWGQAAAEPKEKTITITKSEFDKYVAAAVAADREKAGRDKPATDEQVLNPQSWHKAIFNNAEYVIYTGPGTAMFHHWVQKNDAAPPARGGAARPPAAK